LQSDRLPVRVGAEAQERVLREPRVQPVGMGKRMMTGFVRVAPEGYRTDAALKSGRARHTLCRREPARGACEAKAYGAEARGGQSKSAKRRTANRLER
jgi:hypothetical protein